VIEYLREVVTTAAAATGGDVHESSANAFKAIFDDLRQSYIALHATGVSGGWQR
jgi:hypothetical protein